VQPNSSDSIGSPTWLPYAGRASSFLELRHASTDRAIIVVVPERRLLAVDGIGEPTSAAFQLGTASLRATETILRSRRAGSRLDAARSAVFECAWWTHPELAPDEVEAAFADRSTWHWQQMIAVPDRATEADIDAAILEERRGEGPSGPPIRAIHVREGRAAQMLHVGTSGTAVTTLGRLYRIIGEAGMRPAGHIHELRLADDRDVPLERARSILRIPIDTS